MEETSAKPKDSETSVKETIESILIAFILAFIFRGFVVEAFVIPTGSMAPTLLGAHLRSHCRDCGYEWTANFGTRRDDSYIPARAGDYIFDRDGRRVAGNKVYRLTCPNCGYRVPRVDPIDPNNSATNPPVAYGDRILVLKYLYLFQQPRRWDVVVFKSPEEPETSDYQTNYIKRLLGRPGENVMILDGDVYVSPNVEGKDPSLEDFAVQTKPRHVQDALWRIVYDNDYLAQNTAADRIGGRERKWQQPWTRQVGQTGWQPLTGRQFAFDNLTGAADIVFDAQANSQTYPLTDWLAYDVTHDQGPGDEPDALSHPPRRPYEGDENVSDVRLSFFYRRTSGDGPIRASLKKLDDTFIAEIASDKARILRRTGSAPEAEIASTDLKLDLSQPTRIDLINCDYQVTLRIHNKPVLQTTPQQYRPDVKALLRAFNERRKLSKPIIRITAAQQKCEISHLSLWRDVYYLNRSPGFNGGGDVNHATPFDFPNRIIRLGANPPEYFCCGDNSPISGDGRYWHDPISLPHEGNLFVEDGKVPERFLLGKAFFVYWPAGFRPIDSAPAIVPNFGGMRFIH